LKNKKFLVSVLVINYNKQRYVSRCLNSLSKQNYKKFEVIFSDDKSEDNSIFIAQKFKKILNLRIISAVKRTKFGAYNQMNSISRAFKESTGDIILFLDSDDFFHKKKISNIVEFFNLFPNSKVIFDVPYIYYSKKKIEQFKVKNNFFKGLWPHFPPQSCISIKRDYFKKIYSKISFQKFNDIWLDFRIAFYTYYILKDFRILNKRLTYYFIDPDGASSHFRYLTFEWWKRRMQAFQFCKYFLKKNLLRYSVTLDYILTMIIFKLSLFFQNNEKKN
jgi:glycosyltransferase involved in cell wall biosynthesis